MSDATHAQLERLLEAQIVTALEAVISDRPVIGFWQAVSDGLVKTVGGSTVAVRMQPRESVGWDARNVTMHLLVNIKGASEDDPTGAAMVAAFEAALGVFGEWDTDDDAAAAALDVTGLFRCDAVMFAPGSDCGWDEASGAWFAVLAIDIKGYVLEPVPEDPEPEGE